MTKLNTYMKMPFMNAQTSFVGSIKLRKLH